MPTATPPKQPLSRKRECNTSQGNCMHAAHGNGSHYSCMRRMERPLLCTRVARNSCRLARESPMSDKVRTATIHRQQRPLTVHHPAGQGGATPCSTPHPPLSAKPSSLSESLPQSKHLVTLCKAAQILPPTHTQKLYKPRNGSVYQLCTTVLLAGGKIVVMKVAICINTSSQLANQFCLAWRATGITDVAEPQETQ